MIEKNGLSHIINIELMVLEWIVSIDRFLGKSPGVVLFTRNVCL